MQPAYLPWLGYFDRTVRSDMLIVLDDVQIDANSQTKFANRNRIRTAQGAAWLTVPIGSKGRRGDLALNRIELAGDTRWQTKHLRSIELNYRRAAYFDCYFPAIEALYQPSYTRLIDLTESFRNELFRMLEIETEVAMASALGVEGTGSERILALCQQVQATSYVSGPFGRDYLDATAFRQAGVELLFHDYAHPQYPQVFQGFESHLSIVDLLMNSGTASRSILLGDEMPFTQV